MAAANRLQNARRRLKSVTGVLVLSATFGMACSEHVASPERIVATAGTGSTSARPAEADATVDLGTSVHWNEVARSLVASHNTNAPMASRVYALVSVAQFAAVVATQSHGQARDRDSGDKG